MFSSYIVHSIVVSILGVLLATCTKFNVVYLNLFIAVHYFVTSCMVSGQASLDARGDWSFSEENLTSSFFFLPSNRNTLRLTLCIPVWQYLKLWVLLHAIPWAKTISLYCCFITSYPALRHSVRSLTHHLCSLQTGMHNNVVSNLWSIQELGHLAREKLHPFQASPSLPLPL